MGSHSPDYLSAHVRSGSAIFIYSFVCGDTICLNKFRFSIRTEPFHLQFGKSLNLDRLLYTRFKNQLFSIVAPSEMKPFSCSRVKSLIVWMQVAPGLPKRRKCHLSFFEYVLLITKIQDVGSPPSYTREIGNPVKRVLMKLASRKINSCDRMPV